MINWDNSTKPEIVAERAVARQVVRDLLDAGFFVALANDEGFAVARTKNYLDLVQELNGTGTDFLVARDSVGVVGVVQLTYYNGPCDLIADYCLELEDALAKSLRMAAAFEQGV